MQYRHHHAAKGVLLTAILAALTVAGPGSALSEKIILKTGQEIVAENVMDRGDHIRFFYNDLLTRIPKGEIARIEKDYVDTPTTTIAELTHAFEQSAADRRTASTEDPEKRRGPSAGRPALPSVPARDNGYLDPIISAISDNSRLVGYRELVWGCSNLDIYGLEKIGGEPDFGGIEKYVLPKEPETFGSAKVDRTVYRFWNDQLLSITIWADGEKNYAALKREAFARFGKGWQGSSDAERYIWPGGASDRYLEYDRGIRKGLLWMRNRALWDRISQINPSSPAAAAGASTE
jgi:hypothetical protein